MSQDVSRKKLNEMNTIKVLFPRSSRGSLFPRWHHHVGFCRRPISSLCCSGLVWPRQYWGASLWSSRTVAGSSGHCLILKHLSLISMSAGLTMSSTTHQDFRAWNGCSLNTHQSWSHPICFFLAFVGPFNFVFEKSKNRDGRVRLWRTHTHIKAHIRGKTWTTEEKLILL